MAGVHDPAMRYSLDGLEILLDLSQHIGICLDLDTLLGRIEVAALRVLDCERLTVFLCEPITHDLRSRLATGVKEIRTSNDSGIAGAAFTDGVVINVPDVAVDPRFNDDVDRRTGYRTHSVLSVPLRGIDSEIIGVLELLNKRVGAFTPVDE
jgi:adenylate cyclase